MSDTHKLSIEPQRIAPDPDLTGRKLGDYRLLRRLGRGGMGEVYLAEQESLRRQVAIKILRPSLATDTNYVQRFAHEARAAARLTHANIVQIYEVGTSDGIHYIAQEYVPGQNLRQLLTRRGRPLDLPMAIAVIRQVCAALQKASEQGIVHRDIKPENIMLTPEGDVKVADFGLARVTNDTEQLQLTQFGMTMGSPLYMSPEQAEGGIVDPRSDLYSFGATCYHMIGGRTPFTGESPLALALQHVKREPAPLLELRPDAPAGLCRLVHRLLAKRPENRFQSAAEVLRALRALRSEGVSDELLEGLEGWSAPELLALNDTRQAATQRLDRLLKSQSSQVADRWRWWIGPAAIVGGLIVGVFAGNAMRPPELLAERKAAASSVQRYESLSSQLFYANNEKSEAAWKAVPLYFPPEESAKNLHGSHLASKGLADFYRHHGRPEEAVRLYEQLSNLDPAERELRLQGHAGLALVYASQNRRAEASKELAHVWDQRFQLDDETRSEIERLQSRLKQ